MQATVHIRIDKLFLDCLLKKNFSIFNVYKKLTKHYFIKCENCEIDDVHVHTQSSHGDTATLLCFWMVCILLHMTRAELELGQTAFGLRSQALRSHRLAFTQKVYRPMVRPSFV